MRSVLFSFSFSFSFLFLISRCWYVQYSVLGLTKEEILLHGRWSEIAVARGTQSLVAVNVGGITYNQRINKASFADVWRSTEDLPLTAYEFGCNGMNQ